MLGPPLGHPRATQSQAQTQTYMAQALLPVLELVCSALGDHDVGDPSDSRRFPARFFVSFVVNGFAFSDHPRSPDALQPICRRLMGRSPKTRTPGSNGRVQKLSQREYSTNMLHGQVFFVNVASQTLFEPGNRPQSSAEEVSQKQVSISLASESISVPCFCQTGKLDTKSGTANSGDHR
jgi:hypothetical protein